MPNTEIPTWVNKKSLKKVEKTKWKWYIWFENNWKDQELKFENSDEIKLNVEPIVIKNNYI